MDVRCCDTFSVSEECVAVLRLRIQSKKHAQPCKSEGAFSMNAFDVKLDALGLMQGSAAAHGPS